MKQGKDKYKNHYLEWFRVNIDTVELAKGGHIFCSKEVLFQSSGENPSDQDISREVECNKAVLLLKNGQ